ncbi:MAG: FAD-binding oxidoreductase [Actinomyces sp.]|nr:MAG: FAD-binding oxidoreductase [Actinomyces sp.]
MPAMTPDDLLERLRRRLGPHAVLTGDDAAFALVDHRRVHRGAALAVVRPRDTAETAAVVALAAEAGVALVPQGGNTGLSGGAVPPTDRPALVVSTARLDRIERVDPVGDVVVAGAGVTIQAVQEAAAGVDRLFAPDWGARGTATVGGAIATNAGGLNVLAYGPLRHHVLGLEVVLGDGRVHDGLRPLRKNSAGVDLTHLFIGAEGTLGIVTRASLALLPRPRHQRTALIALARLDAVADLLPRARERAPGRLTAFELVPEAGMGAVVERFGIARPLATRAAWYVLVRFAGPRPVDDDLAAFCAEAVGAGRAVDAVVAASTEQEERLWLIRDELPPPGLFADAPLAVKADLAVPVDRVVALVEGIEALVDRLAPGARPYVFGHVGDGNLHVHLLPGRVEPGRFAALRPDLIAALDELTWSLEGTISAEHGVGLELRDRIAGQIDEAGIDLLHRLKQAVDPAGIMNPGKTLPRRRADER